jgi:hypothetical protein
MEDPFAGRERLNQLTPKELLQRNDRMSAQPQSRAYTKNMTQEEVDEASRQYFRSLTNSRNQQEIAKQSSHNDSNEQHPALPYGWGERLNQTVDISGFSTDDSNRIMPKGPQITNKEAENELEAIACDIKKLTDEVNNATRLLLAATKAENKDPEVIKKAKEYVQSKKSQLQAAQDKETELLMSME